MKTNMFMGKTGGSVSGQQLELIYENMDKTLETLNTRKESYGVFKDGAAIMQRLKDVMQDTRGWGFMAPDQRESLDMIASKIGRLLNGDPDHVDSWHDIAGYARLVEERLNGKVL
jgi:hypothetical protein